jgi:hypothetical protein
MTSGQAINAASAQLPMSLHLTYSKVNPADSRSLCLPASDTVPLTRVQQLS